MTEKPTEQDVRDDGELQREGDWEHKLTGLRFPTHILNENAEPLCGWELSDDHIRLMNSDGPEPFVTIEEKVDEYDDPLYAVSNFCGNCLRSYLANNDFPELEKAKKEWEEVTAQ